MTPCDQNIHISSLTYRLKLWGLKSNIPIKSKNTVKASTYQALGIKYREDPKMINVLKSSIILLILALFTLSAFASDSLLKSSVDGRRIELDIHRDTKELVLSVFRDGRRRATLEERFDISNPTNIDAHMARTQSLLSSQGIEQSEIDNFLTILEEFKFVSTANCQAIHLGEELTSDTRAIEDLVSEFDRISAGIRGEGNFERSIELFEVSVPELGKFQLRSLVDSNGNPVRLSLTQDGGTLKDFKVVRNGDVFTLSSPAGKKLLTIKNYGMNNSLITVSVFGGDSLENEVRSHLKLEAKDRNLSATLLAGPGSHAQERLGNVQLTSVSIEHRPVVRHEQLNIFIPTLEPAVLQQRVSQTAFGTQATSVSNFSSSATGLYDACLAEAFILRRELAQSYSDSHLENTCISRVALELSDQALAANPNKQQGFRTCLIREGVLVADQDLRRFSSEFLSSSDRSKVALCSRNLEEESVSLALQPIILNSLSVQDDSFTPLARRITQLALADFRACQGSECREKAMARARHEVFKVNFLKWFDESTQGSQTATRDRLVSTFQACSNDRGFDSCRDSLMISALQVLPENMYNTIARESGFANAQASSEDIAAIKACVLENRERISFADLSSVDEWRYRCSFDRFKVNLPVLGEQYWSNQLSKYPIDRPMQAVIQSMTAKIAQVNTPADAKRVLFEASPIAYAHALATFVDERLAQRLPISGEESVFQAAANEQVRERLSAMTEPGSYDLSESTAVYLSRAQVARGQPGLEVAFNDIVMRAHIVPRQFEIVSNLGAHLNDEQLEQQTQALTSEYERCWRAYDASSGSDVLAMGVDCDKQAYAAQMFTLASANLRSFVSRRFPLATQEANEILTPLYYMDKCFKDGDPLNEQSVADFEAWVNSCVAVTKIDIASNLFEKLEQKYRPVLGDNDRNLLKSKLSCFVAPLKAIVSPDGDSLFKPNFTALAGHENSRSLDDILAASDNLVGAGSILSAMFTQENFDETFKESDRSVLQAYLNLASQAQPEKLEGLMTSIESCVTSFDETLSSGFRAYLVNSVPSLYQQLLPMLNSSTKGIVEEIIDVELAELLLAVQAKNEYRVVESDSPGGTIVTSEFTISAMARFIQGLGSYISQGFVFDMDGMKTELVIFKEELKDALRWVVESNEPVSLDELSRFFSESKLADHMALAHVAKNTNDNFHGFLSSMYDKEVSDFWDRVRDSNSGFIGWITGRDQNHLSSSQRTELREMEAKYDSLKALSNRMTSGYDFRRIFNVYNEDGRAALEVIKEQEFMPRLVGRTPSAVSRAQVDTAIATRILADNTAGGFAERFVREMAQEYLTKQSRSKWGITKWLFYDSGDFDWEVIRETASGRKAIEYYGRYVLLPKMLGQNMTRYSENIHKRRFEALLREAQSEN